MEDRPAGNRFKTSPLLAWPWVVSIIFVLALAWAGFGIEFYHRVIPFYDSLSYQDGYDAVAQEAQTEGVVRTIASVWRESNNNVVLYKFAAAMLGPIVPNATRGLYIYLLGIHIGGCLVLLIVAQRNSGSWSVGVLAVAAWLAAVPFSLLRDGVADQRMDFAAASWCLMVAALALRWCRRPSKGSAIWLGFAASLAALHRPVMAVTIFLIVAIFGLRSIFARRRRIAELLAEIGWMLGPSLLLAIPWLWAHAGELYRYYFVRNVDLGNAASAATAAWYNIIVFARAVGPTYALIVVSALVWLARGRRLSWADFAAAMAALVVPLAVLALSKATGNVYVAQVGLGLPALMIACTRPPRSGLLPSESTGRRFGLAMLLLVSVGGFQIWSLYRELDKLPANGRREVEEIVRVVSDMQRHGRLASFQDYPVNVVAIARVARDLGTPLQVGTHAYHAPEFGLANRLPATIAAEEIEQAALTVVHAMMANDDVLLLPTADTQNLLLPEPFSHKVIPQVRLLIQADAHFQHERRIGPVDRMWFDLYRIRRR